jgi:hypothetical protein
MHAIAGMARSYVKFCAGSLSPRPLPEGRGSYPCRLTLRFQSAPNQAPLPSERGA